MSFASRVPDWAKHGQKKKSEIPEGYVLYGKKKKKKYARPYRPHGTFKALEKKGVLHTAKVVIADKTNRELYAEKLHHIFNNFEYD
mmetsp:Transcript_42311/g.70567  ORF Transcript_42311/g.70567 Transcript_42311/m.70567 type:complete len:86 (-) Transcript_42311:454-711(-)